MNTRMKTMTDTTLGIAMPVMGKSRLDKIKFSRASLTTLLSKGSTIILISNMQWRPTCRYYRL